MNEKKKDVVKEMDGFVKEMKQKMKRKHGNGCKTPV